MCSSKPGAKSIRRIWHDFWHNRTQMSDRGRVLAKAVRRRALSWRSRQGQTYCPPAC